MTRCLVLLLIAVPLVLPACRAEPEPAADTAAPPAASALPVADTFAPQLGVELDAMTRTGSGLYVQDLEQGEGEEAAAGRTVSVMYAGWLPNGTEFDRSPPGEPFEFPLGAGYVIPGWDEGVAGMREGGRRRLVIPPALAYGDRGAGGVIPPGATLVFEVELLRVD